MSQRHDVQKALYPVLIFLALAEGRAHAGNFRLESAGFLKRASDRGDTSSLVVVNPEFDSVGRRFEAHLNLQAISFLSDRSSFTVEATDAYVATSRNWMSLHQLTLGRRAYDWSEADDVWKLGLWSPRFMWDPVRPQTVGLTGLFYAYRSRDWSVLGMASPLAAPERGFPVRQDRGRLVSASPDWVSPFDQLTLMNQKIDIRYTIAYPPLSELVMNPGAGLRVRYGRERDGPWLSAGAGVMPMNQPDLATEATLEPQSSVVRATIHPRVLFRRLATAEAGWAGRVLSFWSSYSHETPLQRSAPPEWLLSRLGPATLLAAGGSVRPFEGLSLDSALLYIDEKRRPLGDETLDIVVPPRFPFTGALRAGASWNSLGRFSYAMNWTFDLAEASNLISLDTGFRSGSWRVGVGMDLFSSATGRGLIGQYDGNDRVRSSIAYAF